MADGTVMSCKHESFFMPQQGFYKGMIMFKFRTHEIPVELPQQPNLSQHMTSTI